MKKIKQPYRLLSAFTLMLFLGSVLLPATLSAASLLCDSQQPAQGNQHASTCWNMNSPAHTDGVSQATMCSFQKICDQVISGDQPHAEAIPQFVKSFAIAFAFTKLFPEVEASTRLRIPHSEVRLIPDKPPLFLLNSSFLN